VEVEDLLVRVGAVVGDQPVTRLIEAELGRRARDGTPEADDQLGRRRRREMTSTWTGAAGRLFSKANANSSS
jgi:hypothetical protein